MSFTNCTYSVGEQKKAELVYITTIDCMTELIAAGLSYLGALMQVQALAKCEAKQQKPVPGPVQHYSCTPCIQAVTHCLHHTHELAQLLMASSCKGNDAVQNTASAD